MGQATLDEAAVDRLHALLTAPGPSGAKGPAAAVWRSQAAEFADPWGDPVGNSYARVGAATGPPVLLLAHIDEIGLLVTHVDDDGLLRVRPLGTWDTRLLPGRRVLVRTAAGEDVPGVLGTLPIHLLKGGARDSPVRAEDVWVDIGAPDGDTARALVGPGDAVVVDAPPRRLGEHRLTSRALDNRTGALVVLEAARRAAAARVPVIAAAPTLEETTLDGGRIAAHVADPAVTIVIDVTHAAAPGADPGTIGGARLGGGPTIARGLGMHPGLSDRLRELARDAGIPHVVEAVPGSASTDTDVDGALDAHAASATALIGLPLRHMHSPAEVCDLRDLAAAIDLVARLCLALDPEDRWDR